MTWYYQLRGWQPLAWTAPGVYQRGEIWNFDGRWGRVCAQRRVRLADGRMVAEVWGTVVAVQDVPVAQEARRG